MCGECNVCTCCNTLLDDYLIDANEIRCDACDGSICARCFTNHFIYYGKNSFRYDLYNDKIIQKEGEKPNDEDSDDEYEHVYTDERDNSFLLDPELDSECNRQREYRTYIIIVVNNCFICRGKKLKYFEHINYSLHQPGLRV